MLTVAEDGTLRSHLSVGGAPFESGEPLPTNAGGLALGDVVPLAGGDWLALGSGGEAGTEEDTELLFEPIAFRSADGLTWEQVAVTGFAAPVDIADVTVVDGTVVVAGAYRTAQPPSEGGFEGHLWTSTDGASYTEVDLPEVSPPRGYRNESHAGHLLAAGERLLAAGRGIGDRAALDGRGCDVGAGRRPADQRRGRRVGARLGRPRPVLDAHRRRRHELEPASSRPTAAPPGPSAAPEGRARRPAQNLHESSPSPGPADS